MSLTSSRGGRTSPRNGSLKLASEAKHQQRAAWSLSISFPARPAPRAQRKLRRKLINLFGDMQDEARIARSRIMMLQRFGLSPVATCRALLLITSNTVGLKDWIEDNLDGLK